MLRRHSSVREGAVAGIIGATSVAAWFLIVDLITARPFFTPSLLGSGFFSFFGATNVDPVIRVLGYTGFHYAAFILVGIIVTAIIHQAAREASVLAGSLIFFVVVEAGAYWFIAMLSQAEFMGRLAWYQIAAGNLVAAVSMGAYLWRGHPALAHELAYTLNGGVGQDPSDMV